MKKGKRANKTFSAILFFAGLLVMTGSLFLAKELTIERIFSDPRLEGIAPARIRWTEDGTRFAFLWNSEGEKNLSLWLYNVETKNLLEIVSSADLESEITEMPEEEKQRRETMRISGSGLSDFLWSPDCRKILIPYHSDLFLYDLGPGMLRRITRTDKAELDPKFCGVTDRICFVRDNDLWLMDMMSNEIIQLTSTGDEKIMNGLSNYIALEELGRYSSYECSPDGERIAYIQSDLSPVRKLIVPDYLQRYVEYETQERPVAGEKNAVERIGIVPAAGGKTQWLDIHLKDFYVVCLRWLDSHHLFLWILERNNKKLHLYCYDCEAGSLQRMLLEEDDRWVNIHNNFIEFTKEPKGFLWTSEKNGFNHLYFYDMVTKNSKQLTDGKWEISALFGMDENMKIYFVSTGVEPQQRHLFSLNFLNGRKEQMTAEEGWHNIFFSPDFKHFVDLYSDDRLPWQLYLVQIDKLNEETHAGEKVKIIDAISPELSTYDLPALEYFKVKSRDSEEIYFSMMKPTDFQERRKYPVIVHVHGGGYAQSVKKLWKGTWYLFHVYLAQELKAIIVDIDYRGSSGYGRKCRTDVYKNLGGKDLDDVVDVVEWLKKLKYIDSSKLGIWGWSYGGFLANMAMLKTPDLFKVGVAVAPVSDWRNYDTQYTEERLTTPEDDPDAYGISSPITYAKNLRNRLLVIHGMKDDNVHFQDTVQLINEFIKNRIDFDLMIYPEGRHGIGGDASRTHLFKKMASYFKQHLK
ncbi:MAG: alpha/beta fold hydrolase [Acidobacteriota bacterium]